MKHIPLTQGKFALVDDEDYDALVSMGSWYFNAQGYAAREDDRLGVRMHRLLLGASPSQEVDHVNGNKLDNRKSNLRFCSHAENGRNRGPNLNSRSGIKGVTWCKSTGSWSAEISKLGKKARLGRFSCPLEAADAYDQAALGLFGEFAWLNNLTELTPEHLIRLEAAKQPRRKQNV